MDPNSDEVNPLDLPPTFVEHQELIESLSKGYVLKSLKLFVSSSANIPPNDYKDQLSRKPLKVVNGRDLRNLWKLWKLTHNGWRTSYLVC